MKLQSSANSLRNVYPDLWEASWLQAQELCKLQSKVLAEFPEYYKQLPDSLERFVFKTKDGLLDFEKLVKQFPEILGFIVIKPYMRFDDLMGNVKNYGISYPGILDPALSDSYPEEVTVGDNLEKVLFTQIIQHDLITIY